MSSSNSPILNTVTIDRWTRQDYRPGYVPTPEGWARFIHPDGWCYFRASGVITDHEELATPDHSSLNPNTPIDSYYEELISPDASSGAYKKIYVNHRNWFASSNADQALSKETALPPDG